MSFLFRKLIKKHVWKRVFLERLCEPIHLNLLSIPAALFGSFRTKVRYDLVVRQQHAFGMLQAADWAKECGVEEFSAIEFGVANGAGLINMSRIANASQTRPASKSQWWVLIQEQASRAPGIIGITLSSIVREIIRCKTRNY